MAMGTTVMEAVDARRNFRALPDAIPVGLRSAIQPLLALDPKDRPQYVDRLFVVPGAFDGATDPDPFLSPTHTRTPRDPRHAAAPSRTSRMPIVVGLATAAPAPPTAAPVPVIAAVKPPVPSRRGPSAADRLRIVGMLTNAKLALGENRLMSPAGDNAYHRYRSVLRLEPGNSTAKSGLREIASRYVKRASEAVENGDATAARDHLRHARQADPSNSGIRAVEKRLSQ